MGSYINGTSYVLRKADDPFQNLFNDEQIITKSKVERLSDMLADMERKLHEKQQ